jgi:hypothetical protein
MGSTATGFKTTQSTVDLNGADKGLVQAQTAMTESQVEQSRDDRQRLAQERIVTARLLRGMSTDYHERVFLTLAEWVEAGGDPDFAFKYALAHVDEGQTRVLPQQALVLSGSTQASQMLATSQPVQVKAPTNLSVQTHVSDGTTVDEAVDEMSWYLLPY